MQLEVRAFFRSRFFLEEPSGPGAQIVFLKRSRIADVPVLAHADPDPIAAVDESKHRLQLVHAVGTASEHVQEEVQLPRRGVPLQGSGYFHSDNFVSNEVTFQHVIPELVKSHPSGGVYLGVDSPVGPIYLGSGWGEHHEQAFYFFLGRTF